MNLLFSGKECLSSLQVFERFQDDWEDLEQW